MKPIAWLGNTHQTVKEYLTHIRQEIGYNLDKVQRGLAPCDWKPMNSVGRGVKEIRIHEESIYVLHSFVKKTEQTAQKDIELGKRRYSEMLSMRRALK